MPRRPSDHPGELLKTACARLGRTQKSLGQMLGVSSKTMTRWIKGHPYLGQASLRVLCAAVHDVDPALAARIAAAYHTDLPTLGVVEPGPTSQAPAPPDPRADRLLADAILCRAAEAADLSPKALRAGLAAALALARDEGVTLERAWAMFAAPTAAKTS